MRAASNQRTSLRIRVETMTNQNIYRRVLALAFTLLVAQVAPSAAQERPARGTVIYEGVYSGRAAEGLLFLAGEDIKGAITLTVNFEGTAITATSRTTGKLPGGRFSGSVVGDRCELVGPRNVTIEGQCTGSVFSAKIVSQPVPQRRTTVTVQLSARSDQVSKADMPALASSSSVLPAQEGLDDQVTRDRSLAQTRRADPPQAPVDPASNTLAQPTTATVTATSPATNAETRRPLTAFQHAQSKREKAVEAATLNARGEAPPASAWGTRPTRGQIIYEGTYTGSRATKNRPNRAPEAIAGSIRIAVNFDETSVRIVTSGDGLYRYENIQGQLKGDLCQGTSSDRRNAAISGECGSSAFNGKLEADEGRTVARVEFRATRVAAFDAIAAEQRKKELEAQLLAEQKLPMPDKVSAVAPSKPSRSLYVELQNIDDIGYVLIRKEDGNWSVAAWAEWTLSGAMPVQGTASAEIGKDLGIGRNVLVIGVHNKRFPFGPGRWLYNFQIRNEENIVWSNSGGQDGGGIGTRYWKTLVAMRSANGLISVRDATVEEVAEIFPRMIRFNTAMISRFAAEDSVANAIVSGATAALLLSPSTSKTSAECDVQCQMDQADDRRMSNAFEWASKERGRSPYDYRGN
jgi:hypothetical protein